MLSPRLDWIAGNVALAFDKEHHQVAGVIAEAANSKKLTEFLEGRKKRQHIFFLYQRAEASNEGNELAGRGGPKLTITSGEQGGIKSRAVYFMRCVPPEQVIRADVACDEDLLFGEVAQSPVLSLSSTLAGAFRPLLRISWDHIRWGSCQEEQRGEFMAGFERLVTELGEAVRAMAGGIILDKGQLATQGQPGESSETVEQYGLMLESWCREIERYLKENLDQQKDVGEPGPRTELEFWRGRMQKITSITEQLKSRECKAVFDLLHRVSHGVHGPGVDVGAKSRQAVFNTLRRWSQINIAITEAFNEAKDNVKYLTTLEKFVEPLYSGTLSQIIESLPALMNSVKMIHTIARYYNTPERMTNLFTKITNQMITNCKQTILAGTDASTSLWDMEPLQLIRNLKLCLELNSAFQDQYRMTKDKIGGLPKGRQFDFSGTHVFGRFDLFCRRICKLIDMFNTIHQIRQLAVQLKSLNNIHKIVGNFKKIVDDFRKERHDLLDFCDNRFDRDYVEFNVRVSDLEVHLQQFINESFTSSPSIEASLRVLKKFQDIFQADGERIHSTLRTDLASKLTIILQNYGMELNEVQDSYEKNKHAPPLVRNMPPVAGNILWARHLLQRISGPMQGFVAVGPSVLSATKEAKRITKTYNRMAKTLVEFEVIWHQAWINSCDAAKSGLQATLIVRHPDDNQHYVNFDWEILQLIRETKCFDRMENIAIPETAKMVLLQEEKFKVYTCELGFMLKEYTRVTHLAKPIVSTLLKPHFANLEFQLRPGMATLTWTSMNIESYIRHAWEALAGIEQLILSVNDIIENRIDRNLRFVQRLMLVDLPEDSQPVSLADFVDIQESHVREMIGLMVAKNREVEAAVDDMLGVICSFTFESHLRGVSESEIIKVKAMYNWNMYQAILGATERSLHALKKRLSIRTRPDGSRRPPFFEVDLQLDGLGVCVSPSIDDIQGAINAGAVAVLSCSKAVDSWDTMMLPRNVQLILHPDLPPVTGTFSPSSFHDRIAQEKEILKDVLLLTGSIQGARHECNKYLERFSTWSWLWTLDIEAEYEKFKEAKPSLCEFEAKIRSFVTAVAPLEGVEPRRQISALMLQTGNLVQSLKGLADKWKNAFAQELHSQALSRLEDLGEVIKAMMEKLNREVADGDIDALWFVMQALRQVRAEQSEVELELDMITQMYSILDTHLPGALEREEQDARQLLMSNWSRLLAESEARDEELTPKQARFKRTLIRTVNSFRRDVEKFRRDYEDHGPMQKGIQPALAVERLRRAHDQFEVHSRKHVILHLGEDLFGLPHQQYAQLKQTKEELEYLDQLYTLYAVVLETIKEWKEYFWVEVPTHMETMKTQTQEFARRCMNMPKQLRQWPAYNELKKEIDDFQEALPLLVGLAKKSIHPRHWHQVRELTGKTLNFEKEDFRLHSLIDARINEYKEDITDICDSADKQLAIEERISEITAHWAEMAFEFGTWKWREVPCMLVGSRVFEIQGCLVETQTALNDMLAQRHSAPFRDEINAKLAMFSDTADMIERWHRVQQSWTSLESVLTAGESAKQMPVGFRKFAQIDKEWVKVMLASSETRLVIECCQSELLRQMLPILAAGLEVCQKVLEGYLGRKRAKFPRFY